MQSQWFCGRRAGTSDLRLNRMGATLSVAFLLAVGQAAWAQAATVKALPSAQKPRIPRTVKATTHEFAAGRVLVRLRSDTVAATSIGSGLPHVTGLTPLQPARFAAASTGSAAAPWFVAELSEEVNVAQAIEELAQNPAVENVEPDFRVRIPTAVTAQSVATPVAAASSRDAYASQQYALDRIQASQAWAVNPGSKSIVVAVLDTGVQWDHPDLAANVWRNPGEEINGRDDDGNGCIDDVCGYDFINNDSNPYDDLGHGSHVAGIVAAVRNNGIGVAGTANVTIMPVKVLDSSGIGDMSAVMLGIQYAARNGASIINMSMGGAGYSAAFEEICRQAYASNVVIFSATGNSGLTNIGYPGSYASVIAVGAIDANDDLAYFSNTGPGIELVAPGVGILSTWAGSGYQFMDGTSMACPYAAGVAALVRSMYPEMSAQEVRAAIDGTADDLGTAGYDTRYGYGCVNAYRALTQTPAASTPPANSPSASTGNDDFENNYDSAHAAVISGGTYNLLVTCDEWFTFTTTVSGQVSIRLDGEAGDLDLYLFDSSARIVARSVDTGSHEQVDAFVQPGTWFLGLSAYQGNGGACTLSVQGSSLATSVSTPDEGCSPESPSDEPTVEAPAACGAGLAQSMLVSGAVLLGVGGRRRGRWTSM